MRALAHLRESTRHLEGAVDTEIGKVSIALQELWPTIGSALAAADPALVELAPDSSIQEEQVELFEERQPANDL